MNDYQTERRGSHMPLETAFNWNWRNPLNIIPLLLLMVFALGLLMLISV